MINATCVWRRWAVCGAVVAVWIGVVASVAADTPFGPQDLENRPKALDLLEMGRRLEAEEEPALAMLRYNRSVLLYEIPETYYRMGVLFERQRKRREAATAYLRAWRLAPEMREARMAILALGYQLPDGPPTDRELIEAIEWSARRDAATSEVEAAEREAIDRERTALEAQAERHRTPSPAEVRATLFASDAPTPDGADADDYAPEPDDPSAIDVTLGSHAYHARKGRLFVRRRQYARALEEFERALKIDPSQIQTRLDMGDTLMRLDRHPRARYFYEWAAEDAPANPEPMLKLGNYFQQLKQYDEARRAYDKALEIEPRHAPAMNNLAVLAIREENFIEARHRLGQILRIDPYDAEAHYNLGIICAHEEDPDAALEHFRRYVEIGGPHAQKVERWIEDLEASAR